MKVIDISYSPARPGRLAAVFAQADQEIQSFRSDRDAEAFYEALSNILCRDGIEHVRVERLFQLSVKREGVHVGYLNHSEVSTRSLAEHVLAVYSTPDTTLEYTQVGEFLEILEPGGHRLDCIPLRPQTWKGIVAHEQAYNMAQLREMNHAASVCQWCRGTGKADSEGCNACDGRGRAS